MYLQKYECFTTDNYLTFQFTSKGPKGSIKKVIHYLKIHRSGIGTVYNLGFGDLDSEGHVNDKIVTNNGDMEMVLSTVANTVYDFLDHYPDQLVYAYGSTPIRTKLYQKKIMQMMDVLSTEFDVFGFGQQGWVEFTGEEEYFSFLIRRK